MQVTPTGRWLHIKLADAEAGDKENLVLLPENYEKPASEYSVATVISDSTGKSNIFYPGLKIVVPTHLIREVAVDGYDTFSLVECSHVVATLE